MEKNLANAKKELRAIVRRRLRSLKLDPRDAATRLYDNLLSLPPVKNAKTIGVFVNFGTELPSRYFIPKLFDFNGRSRIVAVPFCEGSDMRFYRLDRPNLDVQTGCPVFLDLAPSTMGILEPRAEKRRDPSAIVLPTDFDVVVTPGLAFDLRGGRLGRGAGFYDRYLRRLRDDAFVVGIGYDEQIVETVPTDSRDVRLDAVVTPERVALARDPDF